MYLACYRKSRTYLQVHTIGAERLRDVVRSLERSDFRHDRRAFRVQDGRRDREDLESEMRDLQREMDRLQRQLERLEDDGDI